MKDTAPGFISIFFRLEMLGRFPSNKEASDYGLRESIPVWLPTSDDCPFFTRRVQKVLRELSAWMDGDYKD